jgi:S-adenosylmethionine decarboxylase
MTELDRILARKFFKRDNKTGDTAGKEMTELTWIEAINPDALICHFVFDPCGYSMNGIIDGDRYSTIHVTLRMVIVMLALNAWGLSTMITMISLL